MPQVTTFGPEVAHLQRAVGVERRGRRARMLCLDAVQDLARHRDTRGRLGGVEEHGGAFERPRPHRLQWWWTVVVRDSRQ